MSMTWEEMVEQYPDKWVAVKNPVFDGSTLLSGELVTTLDDTEVNNYRADNFDLGYYYKRTIDRMNIGVYYAV